MDMRVPHLVFSSLDVFQSCNYIVAVLSFQLIVSSLRHPDNTTIIKEPLFRKDLHEGDFDVRLPRAVHADALARQLDGRDDGVEQNLGPVG